jgi:hypothetical protein
MVDEDFWMSFARHFTRCWRSSAVTAGIHVMQTAQEQIKRKLEALNKDLPRGV